MTYKNLNAYQKAYSTAVKLHSVMIKLDMNGEVIDDLKYNSRDIISHLGEGYNHKADKAKRFFNFKAIDACSRMIVDLQYLSDTYHHTEFSELITAYDEVSNRLVELNRAILNGTATNNSFLIHPKLKLK